MDEVFSLDDFEAGFLAGWFESHGVVGKPTIEQMQEVTQAYAAFAARLRLARDAEARRSSYQ